MNWADVVVLGPGLGSEPYVEYLVEDILTSAFVPVIIDADGLNTIASHPYLTSYYTENIVITPHLGEMARLTSQKISEIQADLPAAAFSYASHYGITCVLKDAAAVTAGKKRGLYISIPAEAALWQGRIRRCAYRHPGRADGLGNGGRGSSRFGRLYSWAGRRACSRK